MHRKESEHGVRFVPIIQKSKEVPYSAEQMYALVNDIARYKEFVPYCVESIVHTVTETDMEASLTLSAKGIRKTFTTQNRLSKPTEIQLGMVSGPFKSFSGSWKFRPLTDESSEVCLSLSFEFSSRLMQMMFGSIFETVSNKLVDAFVARANEVYSRD